MKAAIEARACCIESFVLPYPGIIRHTLVALHLLSSDPSNNVLNEFQTECIQL